MPEIAEEQQRWTRVGPDGETRRDPSPTQSALWGGRTTGEPDPYGWYNGWCPVHDSEGSDPEHPTAQFNFVAGAMRCLAEERCHPKRSISLTNVLLLMAEGGSE